MLNRTNSSNMKNILMISRQQFGYLVDLHRWCRELRFEYDITVLSIGGRKRIDLEGVRTTYIPFVRSRCVRGLLFAVYSLWAIFSARGYILIEYFPFCSIYKIVFFWKKMILDIRSVSIERNNIKRKIKDWLLKLESLFFDYIVCITGEIINMLNISKEKSSVLPLGADIIRTELKPVQEGVGLLYVGTLSNRDIEKTIIGLASAIEEEPSLKIHYHIVGEGNGGELKKIKHITKIYNLEDKITFYGYLSHDEVMKILPLCNVGVSFVPITTYYDLQPPTKTYEYGLSGLFIIGTGTTYNKRLITNENGLLINDDASDFKNAILNIPTRIDPEKIRMSFIYHTWENVVDKYLKPLFNITNLNN